MSYFQCWQNAMLLILSFIYTDTHIFLKFGRKNASPFNDYWAVKYILPVFFFFYESGLPAVFALCVSSWDLNSIAVLWLCIYVAVLIILRILLFVLSRNCKWSHYTLNHFSETSHFKTLASLLKYTNTVATWEKTCISIWCVIRHNGLHN